MKVAFASNYLNVHQRPFCEKMLETLGPDNFVFVASTPFDKHRLGSGYEDMNMAPFVLRAYEDSNAAERAVLDADVLIGMPYSKPDFLGMRMRDRERLTFAYSERLLKRGLWFRFVPQKRFRVRQAFTKYRQCENFHVLCASAFTSYDLSLFGFPTERCWKWGYFPSISDSYTPRAQCKSAASIVWVARLIQWKRPYAPLQLSRRLLEAGYDFHLTMVGDGRMRTKLERFVVEEGLAENVTLTGTVPNAEVHRIMAEADIFLSTSNRVEGWGAVLNEAMGNGCVPVASSLIGSAPYLIVDGVNGLVYQDGNDDSLFRRIASLLENKRRLTGMSTKARETMVSLWNPAHAVNSFVGLSEALLSGHTPFIEAGPCSPATPIHDSWYGESKS